MTTDLFVLDGADKVGQLEPSAFEAKPRWRDVGGWQVTVAPSPAGLLLREPGAGILAEVDGVAVASGPMTAVQWGPDGTTTASGVDDLVWLWRRLALTATGSPLPETLDYTGAAETVIAALVDDNAGPGAVSAARRILTLADDEGRGTSGTWKARNQPVGDLVREIAVEQGWGLQVRRVDGVRVFSVLVPRDLTAQVRLYDTSGAVSDWTRKLAAPKANYVIAAGTPSGGSRQVSDGVVSDGWGRVEGWVDVRSTAVSAELGQARDAELAEGAAGDQVDVTLGDVATFSYGVDYLLGDTVAVEAGGVRRTDTVVGVDITLDRISPVLSGGRVLPLLPSLGRLTALERRMTNMETST